MLNHNDRLTVYKTSIQNSEALRKETLGSVRDRLLEFAVGVTPKSHRLVLLHHEIR